VGDNFSVIALRAELLDGHYLVETVQLRNEY
jgi:hypothetical protein